MGQFEVGENGTLHIQGLVVYTSNQTPRSVRRSLEALNHPHVELMRGRIDQAVDYVSKEDTRLAADHPECPEWLERSEIQFQFGDDEVFRSRQGSRSDLLEVQGRLDAGESMSSIAENHFGSFVRYHRGFSAYKLLRCAKRTWQTQCICIVGPPGCGKTHLVAEMYPEAFWVSQPNGGTLWFDGYDGQETVVFDEFYGWVQRSLMQRLIDRSPLTVPVKGAMVPFLCKTLIMISNQHPNRWWPNLGLGAMYRRLTLPIGMSYSMCMPPSRALLPLPLEPDPEPVVA